MLSTYQSGIFAVPENPVMRAVSGMAVMPTAGATLAPLSKAGMGCACGIKPFGMGLVNDEGLRLYGDFYGSQQNGGMRLNGDPIPGLGSYWRVPTGMGSLEDFVSNLTSGNFKEALTGNDFASSLPNVVVILGGWWLLSTLSGQVSRGKERVSSLGKRMTRKSAAAKRVPRGQKFQAANSVL